MTGVWGGVANLKEGEESVWMQVTSPRYRRARSLRLIDYCITQLN